MNYSSLPSSKNEYVRSCITTKLSLKKGDLSDSSLVIVFFVMFYVCSSYPTSLSPLVLIKYKVLKNLRNKKKKKEKGKVIQDAVLMGGRQFPHLGDA